ncbi:hypothetical protein OXYTRIMIC_635 [Oxytricha trifallax]|uniref:Uncharacterized protein n=1 Tax=Oxytricha trifallax TaxID=1172189 RepID=A0A073IBB2_9SPIT|nr:hypothetical protein OXYTRIMIC_635 [Oxytricha trifallax]
MGFQQSQIQKHEMLYKQAILTSNNLQFMGKKSKAKQKQKIQSPVSEDQCDENSGYTADFFNEEQLMELKQKESKQKILDHIKKQGILGKQTYKDVKILLKKKFGADTINIHKNWLVSTLNSRKSDSKAATPTNKRKKNSNKKNTKSSTCQGEQNIDGNSNQSQTSLTPSKNEDQSIITGMDYQSLQSDLKHTETEFSQIHSVTTFPELNQIDELIEKKLGELTQKARDDISNMILKQVPELLQTPQFQNLTDQIKESCDRVTKLESLLKSVDYEQISREVAEGREEIQQTFQILVEDIKKVAPTLGVATQESMARNVRRINDQIVELQKTIKDSTNGFKNMEDNLKILTAQDSEQVNLLEINIADVQKKLKCSAKKTLLKT